jgi:ABC-type lipoprotein release transport system permease subunit
MLWRPPTGSFCTPAGWYRRQYDRVAEGALALTRVIRALLFNTDPLDALTFSASAAILLLIAVLSSYLPARRALRVDPTIAMRTE